MKIIKKIIRFIGRLFAIFLPNKAKKLQASQPFQPNRGLSFKDWKALKKRFPINRFKKPCQYCGEPIFVSPGQIAYFHRQCRTYGRNRNA